jgi:hypothetical protein
MKRLHQHFACHDYKEKYLLQLSLSSEFYPGICLTTEKKAWKNLSQGSENLSQGSTFILFYKM